MEPERNTPQPTLPLVAKRGFEAEGPVPTLWIEYAREVSGEAQKKDRIINPALRFNLVFNKFSLVLHPVLHHS